jgi:hypothetical protein
VDVIIPRDVEFDHGEAIGLLVGKVIQRRGRANTGDYTVPGRQGSLGDGTTETA